MTTTTAKRSKKPPELARACPECQAAPGKPCTYADGTRMMKLPGRAGTHAARRTGDLNLAQPALTTMILPLARIRRDGGTQSRAAIDYDVVVDYLAAYQANTPMPPSHVFFDGAAYWLADGFHRDIALQRAQRTDCEVVVHQGTQRDAVLFSCGANASHGLRRTIADKRRAVEVLLRDSDWSRRSDRWIAEHAAVSHPYVARVRAELAGAPEPGGNVSTSREGQDGKEYPSREYSSDASSLPRGDGSPREVMIPQGSSGSLGDPGGPQNGPPVAARAASTGPRKWKDVLELPPGRVAPAAVIAAYRRLLALEAADPEELDLAVAIGLSQWDTREPEADLLCGFIDFTKLPRSPRVLEPSAGRGSLIAALRRAAGRRKIHVTAHEIDPRRVEVLRALEGIDAVVEGDFLRATPPVKPYDLAIANTAWESGADGDFLARMMEVSNEIISLNRINVLVGQERCEAVWDQVKRGDWQFDNVLFFGDRRDFDGPSDYGPRSDHVIVHLTRNTSLVAGGLREPRRRTQVDWA